LKTIHKIAVSFAGAALIVALGVAVLFWALRRIDDAAAERSHCAAVVSRANELLSELKDAETGGRGYLLTGDEAFLETYLAVRDSIPGHLKALRHLTSIQAAQSRLDALDPLVAGRMTQLAQIIELHRNHDTAAALAQVRSGRGKQLMDSIRIEVRGYVQIEETALAQHEAQFQTNIRLLFAGIVVASLVTLLLALSFTYSSHRENEHRLERGIYVETQHLLELQQTTNQQLSQLNLTLQVSEERLAVTLHSIGDGVIATDAAGRVTLLNPVAEQLTGWTQAAAAQRPVDEVFHIISQETRQPAVIPVQETLAHGTIQGLANHTVLVAQDGRECAIADSCAPIRSRDGLVVGAVLVFRDVTEEYAVQQAVRDSERALKKSNGELEDARRTADQANLAKSEFLSNMSHELRSPLNAILGFAQLMETDAQPPTARQSAQISQILQAGWHLLNLINEVLDLAVIESGKVSLSREAVSLTDVLSECRSMMEPQAKKRGIRMVFPRFANPIFVRADMTRLKQIVINLLSNAIKYNREQGSVVVDCTVSAPDRIRISVKDSGTGLTAAKVAQLFQPFNRLGQEAGGVVGTGIGLVVTKRLAELMEGSVGVESKPGEGSTFWCELTAAAAPKIKVLSGEIAVPVRPQRPAGAQQRSVLYIEDNPANMELVKQLIERCPDLQMLTAINGTLGVELARAHQPTVILMDINLPGISGVEALRLLREDPATAHIPVVALSANAMARDIAHGLEAGFFCYLTKPIKVEEFMDTLNTALAFAEKQPAGT
jgi:PAS domain S-box-containing protein